jgi:hypothetical protein
MAHNQFSRRIWANVSVPTAQDFQIWDTYQFKGVDADNGGSWSPATPIVIGGAGLVMNGAGNTLNNGLTTLRGGRMVLGANDYVNLNARTRTEVIQLVSALPDVGAALGIGGTANARNVISLEPSGVSPISASGDFVVPIPSRYLHHGANLTLAALTMRALVQQPTAMLSGPYWMIANIFGMNAANTVNPQLVPTFAPWAASTAYTVGTVVIPDNASLEQTGLYYVATAVAGSGTSGGSPPTWPTSIGLSTVDNPGANEINWKCEGYAGTLPGRNGGAGNTFGGGAVQTAQMSPESPSTGLLIDTTTYDYYLQVIYDVFGGGTLTAPNWLFHSLALTYSGITDMHWE